MRIIALTGGIATGESTVAGMLAGHGAAVVDADRIAREVVEPGTPGLEAVVAAFGRELLTAGGGWTAGPWPRSSSPTWRAAAGWRRSPIR